ncbi:MAG TPA: barstar family protein [Planctomycetaceae bacterium]|jgi:hypothetical protein|nr:barstar family protein [Planctomycetaceae bacterium]
MTVKLIVADDPQTVAPAGAVVVPVSSHIRRKREFFGVMKRHLRRLHLYSDNWDALYDALRDLSSLTDVPCVVLRHTGLPFAPDSRQREIYLEFLSGLLADGGTTPELWIVVPATESAAISHLRSAAEPSPPRT